MEIFNLIRGHFALLINKSLQTPSQGKTFYIESVSTKEGDWQITLKISTGKSAGVYVSDILRVYTYVVSCNKPVSQAQIDDFINRECLTNGRASYIIPLIGTFSDMKVIRKPKVTVEFIPLQEVL